MFSFDCRLQADLCFPVIRPFLQFAFPVAFVLLGITSCSLCLCSAYPVSVYMPQRRGLTVVFPSESLVHKTWSGTE